jgi:uncharacterized surface protein with fasciclin (FAS1) repeats
MITDNNKHTSRILSLLLVLSISFVFIACEEDEDVMDDEPAGTIYQEVSDAASYTILEAAINKAGLQNTLGGSGSYTLLAPSDQAFINAGITDVDSYTADELTEILSYHMIGSELEFSVLAEREEIETLNGILYVTPFNDDIFLNARAGFPQANAEASNGIIHAINTVLFPPQEAVSGIVTETEDLSTLESALTRVGMENVLIDDGPYTIFAPSNEAFNRLLNSMDMSSLDELTDQQLTDILQYHVVSDRVFSTELEAGEQSTLLGRSITISFDSNAIIITDGNEDSENAIVVAGDELGTNGIVHLIDRVLIPE